MIHGYCNAMCTVCPVPSRQPRAQAGSDKKTPISKNTKIDIEAKNLRYRIQISKEHLSISRKSSISVYTNIEVLHFDIDVSSIS